MEPNQIMKDASYTRNPLVFYETAYVHAAQPGMSKPSLDTTSTEKESSVAINDKPIKMKTRKMKTKNWSKDSVRRRSQTMDVIFCRPSQKIQDFIQDKPSIHVYPKRFVLSPRYVLSRHKRRPVYHTETIIKNKPLQSSPCPDDLKKSKDRQLLLSPSDTTRETPCKSRPQSIKLLEQNVSEIEDSQIDLGLINYCYNMQDPGFQTRQLQLNQLVNQNDFDFFNHYIYELIQNLTMLNYDSQLRQVHPISRSFQGNLKQTTHLDYLKKQRKIIAGPLISLRYLDQEISFEDSEIMDLRNLPEAKLIHYRSKVYSRAKTNPIKYQATTHDDLVPWNSTLINHQGIDSLLDTIHSATTEDDYFSPKPVSYLYIGKSQLSPSLKNSEGSKQVQNLSGDQVHSIKRSKLELVHIDNSSRKSIMERKPERKARLNLRIQTQSSKTLDEAASHFIDPRDQCLNRFLDVCSEEDETYLILKSDLGTDNMTLHSTKEQLRSPDKDEVSLVMDSNEMSTTISVPVTELCETETFELKESRRDETRCREPELDEPGQDEHLMGFYILRKQLSKLYQQIEQQQNGQGQELLAQSGPSLGPSFVSSSSSSASPVSGESTQIRMTLPVDTVKLAMTDQTTQEEFSKLSETLGQFIQHQLHSSDPSQLDQQLEFKQWIPIRLDQKDDPNSLPAQDQLTEPSESGSKQNTASDQDRSLLNSIFDLGSNEILVMKPIYKNSKSQSKRSPVITDVTSTAEPSSNQSPSDLEKLWGQHKSFVIFPLCHLATHSNGETHTGSRTRRRRKSKRNAILPDDIFVKTWKLAMNSKTDGELKMLEKFHVLLADLIKLARNVNRQEQKDD